MEVKALSTQRPVPIVTTGLFVVALAVTVTYYTGLVSGVPKTLPTFVRLVNVTFALLVIAIVAWIVSFLVSSTESAP